MLSGREVVCRSGSGPNQVRPTALIEWSHSGVAEVRGVAVVGRPGFRCSEMLCNTLTKLCYWSCLSRSIELAYMTLRWVVCDSTMGEGWICTLLGCGTPAWCFAWLLPVLALLGLTWLVHGDGFHRGLLAWATISSPTGSFYTTLRNPIRCCLEGPR